MSNHIEITSITEQQETYILEVDEKFAPAILVQEAQQLKTIQKQFMESYLKQKDSVSVDVWIDSELSKSLPEHTPEQISQMKDEIISTLKIQEEKKSSLSKAIANGRSTESWFASDCKKSIAHLSTQQSVKYLQNLDDALTKANESLLDTIHTQSGAINQNPNLDGYIAEQYHAQTFNLEAEAKGSPYRAKVLEPKDGPYTKNSVDIEIIDQNTGKVVKRYQSKYCKDAESTSRAFEKGDYRGQQKLVPEDQDQLIDKKTTTVLEAPDGTTSKPLTKDRAKELQEEAQSGNWNELNWNEYTTKDLAIGIGKQAGSAALLGAGVGVGFHVAQKIWNKEPIEGEEMVEVALKTGADFGIKAAAAGALKVGIEKGFITVLPKGTPASMCANIANVAIENVKIMGQMADGDLTVKEGVDKMTQVTVSTVAGIATSTGAATIGATIGMTFGPIGAAVGGFVGGTVGYMAGSKVGEVVVKGAQKIRDTVTQAVSTVARTAVNVASKAANAVKSFCSSICSWFSW